MKRTAGASLIVSGLVCGACAFESEEPPTMSGPRSPIANTARDGDIAIREEFDAARRAGTAAAWDLFIARHPGHPLIAAARAERAALLRGHPTRR